LPEMSRREWVHAAVAASVSASLPLLRQAMADGPPATRPAAPDAADDAVLHWLDSTPAAAPVGVTVGVPWRRGERQPADPLRVEVPGGSAVPAQAWPLAYWPDGSVKWTALAIGPTTAAALRIVAGNPASNGPAMRVTASPDVIDVDTGVVRCEIATTGDVLIRSVTRHGNPTLTNGRLVALRQDGPGDEPVTKRESFAGHVTEATVEQSGPIRAVVRLVGTHRAGDREWLPFVLRLYFYAGSDVIRVIHSFVFDGDEQRDFLCGLGVRFDVRLRDALHDRHVRFVGQGHGLFAESIRTVTGLRRDPGAEVRRAQIDGKPTPPPDQWDRNLGDHMDVVPAWGDFTQTQLCADGFQVRKRTKPGCGWIAAAAGRRAAGVGYIGGISGGVSFGVRDFWQRHPAQLDIRDAHTDAAQITAWLWSPEAQPMDLRFYHDVMGMQTYDAQNVGLDTTYEDYEPGYGTPYGIARTSEISLRIEPATPTREALVAFAEVVRQPPVLVASPARYLSAGVFGQQWTLPDRSNATKSWVEDRLSVQLDHYLREVDQRSWYGFWDHGDVRHTYDADRHEWRYDVGGFAWDNDELSPDLWLWTSFLRTGQPDVFRLAEAMTRHTGEVDVYHLGRFAGLGTRHGVQHWGDSSKQSRISTAAYRRIFYYLSGGDERLGDLLREQLHTIEVEKKIVVRRKLVPHAPSLPLPPLQDPPAGGDVALGMMEFANAMAAWMTQAERTGDPAWHRKVVAGMRGIGDLPRGFFTPNWTMNIDTGQVTYHGGAGVALSHLTACFGLPEVANELVATYGDRAPKFADAWAQYGRLYSGTDAQRRAELGPLDAAAATGGAGAGHGEGGPGGVFKEASLRDAHARATAFAAKHGNDPALARRAWAELLGPRFTPGAPQLRAARVVGPDVLNPVDEMPALSTNGAAQWSLAAIECLALVGDSIS
jgi:hypothetical protein